MGSNNNKKTMCILSKERLDRLEYIENNYANIIADSVPLVLKCETIQKSDSPLIVTQSIANIFVSTLRSEHYTAGLK